MTAQRSLFAPLPVDFHQLALTARQRRGPSMAQDRDVRRVAERTYRAFEAAHFNPVHGAAHGPRPRDWRNLPYALWFDPQHGLHRYPGLLAHYCNVILPTALTSRRPLKWAHALLHVYLQAFAPQDPTFVQLAQAARTFFTDPRVLTQLAETEAHGLQRLFTALELLDPVAGPTELAQDILALPAHITLTQWQTRHALTPGFWLNPFAQQAYLRALQAPVEQRSTPGYIRRMSEWAQHDPGGAFDSANRWLTTRTLDTFFNILRHASDDTGPYRRAFWEAYARAGHIRDSWIALGEEAAQALHQADPSGQLQHARILGKIAPQQCVLMLRIGHILFCDWSHQGRLRAIPIDSRQAPQLHQPQYELFELRFSTALDFNSGRLDDPGLLHFDSTHGGWQDMARQFIARHLGIDLPLDALMPSENTLFKGKPWNQGGRSLSYLDSSDPCKSVPPQSDR